MAWRIEVDRDVQRSMRKLDRQIAKRIVAKLREISQLEDPRSMGKGLTENKSGLWRYRVGDYRIVVDIEDDVLVILVVDVDHRSRVQAQLKGICETSGWNLGDDWLDLFMATSSCLVSARPPFPRCRPLSRPRRRLAACPASLPE